VSSTFDPYENQRAVMASGARCPHCGAVAETSAHDELWRVCRVCGGPRIELPSGVALPEPGATALRKAEKSRRSRAAARAVGVVGAVGVGAGLLLGLLIGLFGPVWGLLALVLVAGPSLAAALVARARAGRQSEELAASLDAAWSSAAQAVVRATGSSSPAELARALSISPERAAELSTMLVIDAELGTLGAAADPSRVRIAEVPEDPRFAALEAKLRAQAEDEADAEADAALAHTERAGARKLEP
jgi:hypothetical protein